MNQIAPYASFDHPSRNPVSFQALFASSASQFTAQNRVTLERICSDSQTLVDHVSELLGGMDSRLE